MNILKAAIPFRLILLASLSGMALSGCILPPDHYVAHQHAYYQEPYYAYDDGYYYNNYSGAYAYRPYRVRQNVYLNQPTRVVISERSYTERNNYRSGWSSTKPGDQHQRRHWDGNAFNNPNNAPRPPNPGGSQPGFPQQGRPDKSGNRQNANRPSQNHAAPGANAQSGPSRPQRSNTGPSRQGSKSGQQNSGGR